MEQLTDRQSVMLKRMGIDVWKLRIAEAGAGQPERLKDSRPDQASADDETPDGDGAAKPDLTPAAADIPTSVDAEAATWVATAEVNTDVDWLFVCHVDNENSRAEEALLKAILHALDLQQQQCSLIWASSSVQSGGAVNGQDVASCLSSQLQLSQPKNIVIFGEALAQFLIGTDKPVGVLRSENYRYEGGASQLYVTYGLGHMLAQPQDKAMVWQDLLNASGNLV